MVKRLVNILVLIPVGIVLIVLSVANRQVVTLALNPFAPSDTLLSVKAPFFVFLFLALISGLLLGSAATWFAQRKYRRLARNEANEALKMRAEAERHKARADQAVARTLLPSLPQ